MLSVFVVFTYMRKMGRKRGQWGLGKGTKMGQLTLSMGPARAVVGSYIQRDTILSKRVIPYITVNVHKHHTCNNI